MSEIKINLSVKLIEDFISPHEKNPELHIFLDARFDRTVKKVPLNGKNHQIEISGKIKERKNTHLPGSTSIVLSAFAYRNNKFSIPVLVDIGVAYINFNNLVNRKKKSFRLPLLMKTAGNYKKGTILIKINDSDTNGFFFNKYSSLNYKHINNYINKRVTEIKRLNDTIQGTSNMKMPYDYSESGTINKNLILPADAFAFPETPKINTFYIKNSLNIVLKRNNLNINMWSKISEIGKIKILAEIICYLAQYLDYQPDEIDENVKGETFKKNKIHGAEIFFNALVTFDDDCDGLGLALYATFLAIKKAKINEKEKELIELQNYLKQYVAFLSLDVVNGAQVTETKKSYGAHLNINIIPFHSFRTMMMKTKRGIEIDKYLKPAYPKVINNELPFIIGEGTGMLTPIVLTNDQTMSMKRYIYNCPSLKGFKKTISREIGDPGSFLVASLKGYTSHFAEKGLNYSGFTYITKKDKYSEPTRGSLYVDMINDHDNIGFIADPKFKRNDMNFMKEAILRADPPHDLILTEGTHKEREINEHLDYIVREVSKFNRKKSEYIFNFIPIYVRDNVNLDRKMAKEIVNDFRKKNKVWKIEYHLEPITDEIYGYCMKIFIDPNK